MQAIGRSLRNAGSLTRSLHPIASSSRGVNFDSRRHASMNPLDWFRRQINPTVRDRKSNADIDVAKRKQAEEGTLGVFDSSAAAAEEEKKPAAAKDTSMVVKTRSDHHKYSTANFKISHRKLNKIGRQIAGKPIDSAILQMTFSEKRASKRIRNMLVVAKSHAAMKGMDEKKLIVSESWVTKGPRSHKRLEPRGRGKHGIRVHPDSRMSVILKEGKTRQQLLAEDRARKLKRIVSAGLVREDVPLRNPASMWTW